MTAVTVSSDVDQMRFESDTRYTKGTRWSLESMDGWEDTPGVRESPTPRPQMDGGFMPSRLTVDNRVLTIRCIVVTGSSVEAASIEARVNDLMARTLTVTVENAGGVGSCEGYLSASPSTLLTVTQRALRFSLIITCPDPLKYGSEIMVHGSRNLLQVRNPGRLPIWPTVEARGRVTTLKMSLAGHQVIWQGNTNRLRIAFSDMTPSTGTILKDDAFRLPPGTSAVRYAVNDGADVDLIIRPAWR